VSIGWNVFWHCSALSSIRIPSSVKTLGQLTFSQCSSLSTVEFESNSQMSRVNPLAFANCQSLTVIWIPLAIRRVFGNYDQYLKVLEREGGANRHVEGWDADWDQLEWRM
jgi:hypothetical protein